jgi:hypothetical protein
MDRIPHRRKICQQRKNIGPVKVVQTVETICMPYALLSWYKRTFNCMNLLPQDKDAYRTVSFKLLAKSHLAEQNKYLYETNFALILGS